MNCKPGELAVVIKGEPPENIGRVIRVTELLPFTSDFWLYEGDLVTRLGNRCQAVADNCLRPLRDSDGPDETLSWVPVPTGVAA